MNWSYSSKATQWYDSHNYSQGHSTWSVLASPNSLTFPFPYCDNCVAFQDEGNFWSKALYKQIALVAGSGWFPQPCPQDRLLDDFEAEKTLGMRLKFPLWRGTGSKLKWPRKYSKNTKIYRKASLHDPCTASVAFTISRTESTRARRTEFGKRAYPVARIRSQTVAMAVAIAVANFEMFDYHQQIAFRAKCWQSVQTAVTSFSLHDENEDFPSRRDFSIPCFRPGVLQRVFWRPWSKW